MIICTYIAEEVFEVVASGVVMSIEDCGIQVLLFMISLSVGELEIPIIWLMH